MSQHYDTSEFYLEMLADEIRDESTGNTDWSYVVQELGLRNSLEYLSSLDKVQICLRGLSRLITLHSKAMECDISHNEFYVAANDFFKSELLNLCLRGVENKQDGE